MSFLPGHPRTSTSRFTVACRIGSVCLWLLLVRSWAAENPGAPFPTAVLFDVPGGLCEAAFPLKLSADGHAIRYTTDGREPSSGSGQEYAGPLQITNTTLLRAAAFRSGTRVSAVATRSYLFLDQVRRQPVNPPGFPSGPNAWNGEPSVYAMDRRIVEDPAYRDRLRGALRALPIVSVVCPKADLFDSRRGIYVNSLDRGDAWERACSVEFFPQDGTPGFQIDCGLRIQGNYNRIPEKSPKHSFRLVFKKQYGPGKLRYRIFPDSPVAKFDTLVLRADYNNSWIHWDPSVNARGQRTRDAWMKDSHRAMGWLAAHNRYVHLFLDGLYWGIYDFTERPDANFAAAYLGGEPEDYDVVNEGEVKDGTRDAYHALQFRRGSPRRSSYEQLRRQLDVTAYIDYLLLNYYAGNRDWGENKNWYAIGRRQPAGPFRYYVWDGEQVFQSVREDIVNRPYEVPFRLAEELRDQAEFRLAFADRVQRHLFKDGVLTPAAVTARWMKRAAEVDQAIIAESARWGGFRRDPPYTRDRDWLTEQRRLVEKYFPQRTGIVLDQLRAAGLYPTTPAPLLSLSDPPVNGAPTLVMAPAGVRILYTTNGVDPRVQGTGTPAAEAVIFTGPVPLREGLVIKSRALKEGVWSALTEYTVRNGASAAEP